MSSSDYPRSEFYGAHSNNYSQANRPGSHPINKIIVHVTQGSWSSAINWFQNPDAYVSAHYTVRSDDGFIGQSVHEEDIAYHAGNYSYNETSIGIEHEGYVSNPDYWFTEAMYDSSAMLSAYLCDKYNIPTDRDHIIGHNEVPEATHTDPGDGWDWRKYMSYIKSYVENNGTTKPARFRDGTWYLKNSLSGGSADITFAYGKASDTPLMGDWNGDGSKTPGIKRGNAFYLRDSNSEGPADIVFAYGKASDTPLVGDWDGDGVDTIGVRRGNFFFLRNSFSGGADIAFAFGKASDTSLAGDWNGDGRDTIGVRRGNAFYLRNSFSGGADILFAYGKASDTPVVGDWDNEGQDTVGVVRGEGWYLTNTHSGDTDKLFRFGPSDAQPLVWRYLKR